jgi:pimeloyl-ACP methyl ester carboxylesterase
MSNPRSPKLVFVHGYCGSGALFFKIFEHLANHICLILVDMVGMGGSDHPRDFNK